MWAIACFDGSEEVSFLSPDWSIGVPATVPLADAHTYLVKGAARQVLCLLREHRGDRQWALLEVA